MNLFSLSPDARRQLTLLAFVWIPAGVLVYLLALQPYTSGYGFIRKPLLFSAADQWSKPDSDWGYCGLVPLICAFILYLDKDRIERLIPRPAASGLLVALLGFALYWAGYRVDNHYIGYAAFQILVAAMIITVLGWKFMGELFFPWAFLAFMWPLLFLNDYLAFPLRLIVSGASVEVLNTIGIHAIKNGTGILSAPESLAGIEFLKPGDRFRLDVADPCSGIRSLFALMMVSALYGYFTLGSWWKRGVLFLASIPLAVVGNIFRILMLTIGVLVFGTEFAIGGGLEDPSWFHSAAGFMVFGVAVAGMVGIHKLLEWRPGRKKAVPPDAARKEKRPKKADAKPEPMEDEY